MHRHDWYQKLKLFLPFGRVLQLGKARKKKKITKVNWVLLWQGQWLAGCPSPRPWVAKFRLKSLHRLLWIDLVFKITVAVPDSKKAVLGSGTNRFFLFCFVLGRWKENIACNFIQCPAIHAISFHMMFTFWVPFLFPNPIPHYSFFFNLLIKHSKSFAPPSGTAISFIFFFCMQLGNMLGFSTRVSPARALRTALSFFFFFFWQGYCT